MKRFFAVLLALLLLAAAAAADPVNLSGMSFDELVALRDQLNIAIWNSREWQEVTVPAGVWQVGADIPAGHWTIRPLPEGYSYITYCDRLDEYGKDPGYGWSGWMGVLHDQESDASVSGDVDLVLGENMYFITSQPVIFTPYAGKPDLGFR